MRGLVQAAILTMSPWLSLVACSSRDFKVGDQPVSTPDSGSTTPFAVNEWRLAWQTPEQVRWSWTTTGEPIDFGGFRLVMAATPQELDASGPSVHVVAEAENPELGGWLLPNSEGPARTQATTTIGHNPGSALAARLEWLVGNETHQSPVLTTTLPPQAANQFTIYEDEAPARYTIPDTFQSSDVTPYSGTSSYSYSSNCVDSAFCWENLRWAEMNLDVSAVPVTALDRAFIEFALSYAGNSPSYWSEFFLEFGSCKPCRFGEVALFFPADGRYHLYHIPLAALHNGSDIVTTDMWLSGIDEFRVGGGWANGGIVQLDRVSVRW